MFQFQIDRMYQMPVQFGPCCGPRQNSAGERFQNDGPQECTQHILVYESSTGDIEKYLPENFAVRRPYIIVTHKMHRNLPWLAGRGYNVVTFDVPVIYTGREETITGLFLMAIWENHADPIICGREQLGYSKLFAEIEGIRIYRNQASASIASWGFPFLKLSFTYGEPPREEELLKSILQDTENNGKLHYKYIPCTGDGFNKADVAYVTLTPKEFKPPDNLPPLPQPKREWHTGSLEWEVPQWNDMPTQYHIVQALAGLPVKKIVGASTVVLMHYNDVYDQRIVR